MKKRTSGFTLLEVMVSMSIIAITLTAVLRMQSQGLSLAGEARFYTTAPLLAKSQMALLMTNDPDELRSDSGNFGEDFEDYSWTSNVEGFSADVPQELFNLIKKVDLSVVWNESETFKYNLTFYRYLPEKL